MPVKRPAPPLESSDERDAAPRRAPVSLRGGRVSVKGQGVDTLFGGVEEYPAPPAPAPPAEGRPLAGALEVDIDQVMPDPGQPRKDWEHDEGERRLEELAGSIREFGILQPLLVRRDGELGDGRSRYTVIAGGRRLVAAQRVGLPRLPIVVSGEDGYRIRIMQLVENVQRQQLNALDEARAYQELLDIQGFTPPKLAEQVNVSAQTIRNRLRLIADEVIAAAVGKGQVTVEAANILNTLPDEEVLGIKERIAAGDQLRKADLLTVRARVQASGKINPRYKGGGRRVPAPALAAPDTSAGAAGAEEQVAVPQRPGHPAVTDLLARRLADQLGAAVIPAECPRLVAAIEELRAHDPTLAWTPTVIECLARNLASTGGASGEHGG